MNKLTRLIYVSRVAEAARRDLNATVKAVLQASRLNNVKVGVTGMLLTHGGYFVQALEGADQAVHATFQRVSRDTRHHEVKLLGADFPNARVFERWAMCANTLSATDDDIVRVLDRKDDFRPYELNAASALKLLTSIAAIQARQKEAAAG